MIVDKDVVVKVEVGLLGFVIVPPAPLTIVHRPVPVPGVFAARVTDDVQLPVTSGPALATVGEAITVMDTVEVEATHGALAIVHLKTYVVPKVPVKVAVGSVFKLNDPPAPLMILQVPVPTAGALPAKVVEVTPHKFV